MTANASRTRPRWLLALGVIVALLALGALGLTAAVLVGKSKIEGKLVAMGDRFGLRVELDAVDVPLIGAIGARGLRVYGATGTLVAAIDRIETDLSLVEAALGASRPGRVVLSGGRVHARIVDGRPVDVTLAERAPEAGAGGPAEPLSLSLADVEVTIEARQSTARGPIELAPLRLVLAEVEVARGADRQLQAGARGVWDLGTRGSVPFTAELDTGRGRVAARLEAPQHVGLATPWGPVWIAVGTIERERGGPTRLTGLDVVRGEDRVTLGRVEVDGGGDGLAPDPTTLTEVRLGDLVVHHDGRSASAAEIVLALAPEAGFRLPSPRRVTVRGLRGEAPEPTTGGRVRGEADEIVLGLDRPQARILGPAAPAEGATAPPERGDPLDALAEIAIVRPKVTLVVPKAEGNGAAAAAGAAPAGEAPEPGDGEAPPISAMLGNDDELPEGAAPPSGQPRTSFSFVDRLFGDGDARDPSLADFVPGALRPRLPGLIARLRALQPVVKEATLEVVDDGGRSLLSLEGASFSSGPSREQPELVAIDLRAAVLRDGREAGRADLTITTDDAGVLQWVEGEISGKEVANRLARFVPGLTVQPDAELALDIRYARPRSEGAPHHVAGTIKVRNFTFQFWRISDREVDDLQGSAAFDLSVDRKGRRLLLNLPELTMGEAKMSGSIDLTKAKGRLPSFTARLAMGRQDCGKVAAAIPKALIPNLSTLAAEGQMEFDASIVVDLENPRELDLAVNGDIDDCRVLSLGPGIDLMALKGPFVHRPREPGRGVLEHIAVGPGTSQWIRSERLPDIVKLAAWVTEDRAWTKHAGVRWELVARALKIDLIHGRFVYGGSTITQQLVKNLYLTRTKNLARKLEEAIIAMQMERVLSKDEILTIYINCIEYGPDIYGVKHAARHYFDKKVDELDALEAAFIMGLKPFPKAGYSQWMKGRLDDFWIRRISHIMRLLPKFGPQYITPEEAEAFAPFQPTFRPPVTPAGPSPWP